MKFILSILIVLVCAAFLTANEPNRFGVPDLGGNARFAVPNMTPGSDFFGGEVFRLTPEIPKVTAQEMVCDENGCRLVQPLAPFEPPGSDPICPCGCGIAGCTCDMGAASFSYAAGSIEDHLINEHGQSPEVVFSMTPWQREALHNSMHAGGFGMMGVVARGNGYGVFGLRERPWFWQVRPFLRARMGW